MDLNPHFLWWCLNISWALQWQDKSPVITPRTLTGQISQWPPLTQNKNAEIPEASLKVHCELYLCFSDPFSGPSLFCNILVSLPCDHMSPSVVPKIPPWCPISFLTYLECHKLPNELLLNPSLLHPSFWKDLSQIEIKEKATGPKEFTSK